MKSGFTFIELLVYVAVLALVLSSATAFFIWVANTSAKNQAMAEVLNNTKRALETISSEVREAKSVYGPTSAADQLSLETNKNLASGEQTGFVDFFLCSQQLCLKRDGQAPIAVTSDKVTMTNLSFTRLAYASSTPSIRIAITVQYKTASDKPERQAELNATSTASLRIF